MENTDPSLRKVFMFDPRIENFAKTIVEYSTRVQPGDKVVIRGFPLTAAATPLINAVTEKVLKAGGYPHVLMTPPDYLELLLSNANEEQLRYINPFSKMVMESFDVDIRISSSENTKALSNIDPERRNKSRAAYYELLQTWFQRTSDGSLRWLTTRFPTSAYAQDAEMSLEEYEQFFYASSFADHADPIGAFNSMAVKQQGIINLFHGGNTVTLKGADIDLSLSIKEREFIRCIGEHNLPDGEIYCGPVESSAQGWVRFSFPCIHYGVLVDGVELEFESGQVVNARAVKNEEYLRRTLKVDEGAGRLGEFGIGLNPSINHFTGDMLFDEKISGTIHLALGAAYPKSGSTNKSSIHWDMLVDMRADSEIRLDGDLIYANGLFQ
jgi:aminopeptidase